MLPNYGIALLQITPGEITYDSQDVIWKEEQRLIERGDTSWTWAGLYSVAPELIEKYNIPTWRIGWPFEMDIVEVFADDFKNTKIRISYQGIQRELEYECQQCASLFGNVNDPEVIYCPVCKEETDFNKIKEARKSYWYVHDDCPAMIEYDGTDALFGVSKKIDEPYCSGCGERNVARLFLTAIMKKY